MKVGGALALFILLFVQNVSAENPPIVQEPFTTETIPRRDPLPGLVPTVYSPPVIGWLTLGLSSGAFAPWASINVGDSFRQVPLGFSAFGQWGSLSGSFSLSGAADGNVLDAPVSLERVTPTVQLAYTYRMPATVLSAAWVQGSRSLTIVRIDHDLGASWRVSADLVNTTLSVRLSTGPTWVAWSAGSLSAGTTVRINDRLDVQVAWNGNFYGGIVYRIPFYAEQPNDAIETPVPVVPPPPTKTFPPVNEGYPNLDPTS